MHNSTADRRPPLGLLVGHPVPRLYDRVVEVLRSRHYSRRTEEAYLHWIRRFLLGQILLAFSLRRSGRLCWSNTEIA